MMSAYSYLSKHCCFDYYQKILMQIMILEIYETNGIVISTVIYSTYRFDITWVFNANIFECAKVAMWSWKKLCNFKIVEVNETLFHL